MLDRTQSVRCRVLVPGVGALIAVLVAACIGYYVEEREHIAARTESATTRLPAAFHHELEREAERLHALVGFLEDNAALREAWTARDRDALLAAAEPICKRLAVQMGGDVGVESVPGSGSTFWVTLELEKGDASQTNSNDELSDLRVLVVDDNETNLRIVSAQLCRWRLAHDTAMNGPDALRMLAEAQASGSPFDVAIVDLQMPGMDGYSVAKAIRSNRDLAGLRLLLLSSIVLSGSRETALEAGFDACLSKPLRTRLLRQTLIRLSASPEDGDSPPEPRPSQAPAGRFGGARILVAEDNPINQRVAARILEKLDCDAHLAANGVEVLDAMRRIPYTLILMDCQMPQMDGYQATKRIRQLEGDGPHVPIVAMTANAMEGDREKCLAAGMDDYIAKPLTRQALQQVLSRWLDREGKPVTTRA